MEKKSPRVWFPRAWDRCNEKSVINQWELSNYGWINSLLKNISPLLLRRLKSLPPCLCCGLVPISATDNQKLVCSHVTSTANRQNPWGSSKLFLWIHPKEGREWVPQLLRKLLRSIQPNGPHKSWSQRYFSNSANCLHKLSAVAALQEFSSWSFSSTSKSIFLAHPQMFFSKA